MKKKKIIIGNKKYFVLSIVFSILIFTFFIYQSNLDLVFFSLSSLKVKDILILPFSIVLSILVSLYFYVFCIGASFFFCEILCHRNFFARLNFFTGIFSLITLVFLYLIKKDHYYTIAFFIMIINLILLSTSLIKAFYAYTYYSKKFLLIFSNILLFIFSIMNLSSIGGGVDGNVLIFYAFLSLIIVGISFALTNSIINRLKTLKVERFNEK